MIDSTQPRFETQFQSRHRPDPKEPYRAPEHILPALTPWCLRDAGAEKWSLEKICRVAKQLGVPALEVIQPEEFRLMKQSGLINALTTSHGYVRGMNNPLHWDECLEQLRRSIDANAEAGFANVITFFGFADTTRDEFGNPVEGGSIVDLDEGIRNCVEGYKKIIGYAESKKITICLESLNTRDAGVMKGHPGYQGAHIDDCLEVMNRVGSPAFKLLFDVYHVQIMDGDLIRRIGQIGGEAIGHVQVAGAPGRCELDADQEINFSPVIRALDVAGYRGYVGLEFIPTRDACQSLVQALGVLGMDKM